MIILNNRDIMFVIAVPPSQNLCKIYFIHLVHVTTKERTSKSAQNYYFQLNTLYLARFYFNNNAVIFSPNYTAISTMRSQRAINSARIYRTFH